ncbi:major facilitator superfamily multidrug-resistance, DHA1 sub-family [Roridomyces roridus]|uniref:Major facilitator superfamily multidrug-resistance, DHA1 sub-family n=1 Tax=Roridomyces roridus TaxID=1738132 RepID=A0AAD7BBX2_9AGAR|nr:major facilitator superfamily multidrug-resistance, DHA1 sub-family [Roridomyces roridus]
MSVEDSVQPTVEEAAIMAKKPRTPIPKLQVFILLLIQSAEPITALVIYPFVIQFVRETGVTGGDDTKIGFYAGLLESCFFMAESLTVFQFGRLSDIYGRRPVLLLAPLGLTITMLGFGLSKRFWTLFAFRCAQGAFNGNIGALLVVLRCAYDEGIGVSKTVMNEISDPTNAADIFSLMPLMWSIGSTMSPFLGGVLANPATKWPDTFGKIELLRSHPYFLPCAVAASLAFCAFAFAFVGLKETLPSAVARAEKKRNSTPHERDPLLPPVDSEVPPQPSTPVPIRQLLTRPVLLAILNHAFLNFSSMAYDSLLPLVYATPIGLGGLGLKPHSIGLLMGLCGLSNAIVQGFYGGRIIRYFGPRTVFTGCFCALVAAYAAYPVLSFFAARAGRIDGIVITVLALQLSSSFFVYLAYATTIIFIIDAAPDKASIGSVNGLAQMVGTILRAIAPSFASSLFALSVKNNLAGGYLVYIILVGMAAVAVRVTFLLPRQLRAEGRGR